jgi:hypothetical protein
MNPSSSPAPAPPLPDDQGWRHPPPGGGDGFTHPTQAIEFKIERVEPKDGTLEVVQVEPSDDELGKRFGSGTYRIWKREGTKLPMCRDVIIAPTPAYGEPRFAHRRSEQPQPRSGRFFQPRPAGQEEDPEERFPQRPYYRPQMDVRPYQQDQRQMADVASRGLSAQESIAVTAVNKLAEINEKQLDRMEKVHDREREPQSTITDFLKEQQLAADKRANDEATRRLDERKKEQEEWRNRESEREAQHKRDQADRDAQHKRDMERIATENAAHIATEREARTSLMELEKQRLALMREEAKIREDALKGELERSRVEAKEERATFLAQLKDNEEKTDERIEEVEDAVKAELLKEREGLKREHELKEKHLENTHKLQEDMLKLREEIVKNQQGEDISKVLTKLVEGVERTVKEVVDLKKIEAVSAEDRLAKVGQQPAPPGGANVTQVPGQPAKTPEQPAAMQGQKTGNGHPVQPEGQPADATQEQTAEVMIRQLSREPMFVQMISKWANQVRAGNDAGIFSNLFMELMRDDGTAEVLKVRKALGWFVEEMSTKTWAEMYDLLKPAIPQNLHATFETPHAEVFYEQFKMMVVESVRDYWRAYFSQKQAEIDAAKQAAQAAQQPQPSPVVVPAAPAMQAETPAAEPKPEVTVSAT